jgi:Na+-translocating ferredoxin:NAD+ oxidoreductase RnfD subunit
MSVLLIGVATLGFRVSIPQILCALVTAIIIDGGLTLRRTGKLMWPASGLNTATGIALIVRVVGTQGGDYWSWHGWYVYVGVVAFALFSKYMFTFHGDHVFNPSNVALVLVFVLLGRTRVEPLDFWWAPLGGWMVLIYLIIVAGGSFTLSRLKLLHIPVTFWLGLAGGLGLLARSGHCFTARWSVAPVCGMSFWWVVVTSPELLFFLFFMITDPKTIPRGRLARVIYATIIALLVTLLIAPQTTEFGAKVGLLAGLALVSPLRWLLDRWFPDRVPERSRLTQLVDNLATTGGVLAGRSRVFLRGALAGAGLATIALLIVVFGTPARQPAQATTADAGAAVPVSVDPATLPPVTVDPDVAALNSDIGSPGELALTLAQDLAIEAEAMRRHQGDLLLGADFAGRLQAMQQQMADSVASGQWQVSEYHFDSLHLKTVPAAGGQGTDLGFEATGTIDQTTYDADGGQLSAQATPCTATFVMRLTPGDRWLIVDEVEQS